MLPAFPPVSIGRRRPLWVVPAVVALLATPPLAGAAAQTAGGTAPAVASAGQAAAQGASRFIRSVGDEVIGVLKTHQADGRAARTQALNKIFKNAFDVPAMARFAAGLYWRRTSPDQRKTYVRLFGEYVATIYADRFADYRGQKFVVTGQRPFGEGVTAVQAQIVTPDKETPVEFRVGKTGGDFRILDVYVAGVSMLITKRDEFNTVLAREGMAGLLQRLKAIASG